MTHIIKARPDTAGNNAVYFPVENGEEMNRMMKYLSDGWVNIEVRKIVNVDRTHEGVLKRCSNGSKNEQINLRWYFNQQPEMHTYRVQQFYDGKWRGCELGDDLNHLMYVYGRGDGQYRIRNEHTGRIEWFKGGN